MSAGFVFSEILSVKVLIGCGLRNVVGFLGRLSIAIVDDSRQIGNGSTTELSPRSAAMIEQRDMVGWHGRRPGTIA